MYQFSLDSYIEQFNNSIDKSKRSSKLEDRIQNLNEYHTYAVYRFVESSTFSIFLFFAIFSYFSDTYLIKVGCSALRSVDLD